MKLPNADNAVVDERKVRDYLLSKAHPIGRFKARVLARAGFESGNWIDLVTQLRHLAVQGDAKPDQATEYGQKYLISAILKGPRGLGVEVTTVWIVPSAGGPTRLVTVYPR